VILFGEHAVVSGAPALGAAVDVRVQVRVEDAPGLVIEARNLDLVLDGLAVDPLSGNADMKAISGKALHATRYVSAVLAEVEARDLRVVVESEIPPSSGLGSSASVVVATLAALNDHMGLGLSPVEIAERAYSIEKNVQNGMGSRMDTALATFGGYQVVTGEAEPVDLPKLDLIVGCTGKPHDTRLEVEKVQKLRARYPDVVDPVFEAMGAISRRALTHLRKRKLTELGILMNVNHGLLESIGVGTRELTELVYAARGAGRALGAKLTGAGGGGCMIALPGPEHLDRSRAMTAIVQAGGKAFPVTTGCEGVWLG